MGENKRGVSGDGGVRRRLAAFAAVAFGLAAIAAAAMLLSKFRQAYLAQCVLSDPDAQIETVTSPHIKRALLLDLFGLTNGCNLALMDFKALRKEILRKQPVVKSLSVTRRLPGGLVIAADERKPIARVNYTPVKIKNGDGRVETSYHWNVVDAEGVVFRFSQSETRLLPRIVEKRRSAAPGEKLSGRPMAALRLIDMCARRDFPSISILDVDVSGQSYLVATTRDYDAIKIDWARVNENGDGRQDGIRSALGQIQSIILSRLAGPLRKEFVVSEEGRVTMHDYGGGMR